ncbi:hypothetical protein PFISCL1PPCAC_9573, partial [Pristionchus fissidentatus]
EVQPVQQMQQVQQQYEMTPNPMGGNSKKPTEDLSGAHPNNVLDQPSAVQRIIASLQSEVELQLQQEAVQRSLDQLKRRREMYAEREADKKKIEELEAKMVEKDEAIAEMKVVNDALINQIQEEEAANLKMEKDMQQFVTEKQAAMAELSEENGKLAKQIHIEVACKREKEDEVQRMTMEITEKNEKLAILKSEKEELTNCVEEVTLRNQLMQEQNEIQKEKEEQTKTEMTKDFNEKLMEAERERTMHVFELKKRMETDHETAVRLMNEVDEKEETIKEMKKTTEKKNEEMKRLRKIESANKRIKELENGKTFCCITATGFCWFMLIVSLLVTTVTSIVNWTDEDSTLTMILFGINVSSIKYLF